jgi:L-iditol 2-dehydrogenase
VKKAIINGPRKAELIEVPDPRPVENWALVKVSVAPMCTEYKAFLAGARQENLGHEAVGVVVETAQPGRVKEGDRVVVMPQYPCGVCAHCVRGDYIYCEDNFDFAAFTGSVHGSATYAQYLLKPDWLLAGIPEDVTDELASLALCALGPSFGAFDRMQVNVFDRLLVTGAGPVGLGAVVNAAFLGARVIVLESNPYRVERAYHLGAELVVDPNNLEALNIVRLWSGGNGVDKAVDCSGVVAAQRFCIDAVRRRGQVSFVGECGEVLPIKVSPDMIRKGLTIHGSWHYNLSLYPKILQMIQRSDKVCDLISHIYPMSELQEALELSASQQNAKILLRPWE